MSNSRLPSVDLLRQVLSYNPETGVLTWKRRSDASFLPRDGRTPSHIANAWNAAFCGREAFTSAAKNRYLRGAVNGITLYAHRVAWAIYYGEWPEFDIDHINGIRGDNRIANLRSVTRRENMKNRSVSSNNTSGVMGVSYSRRHKLWCASIGEGHLGWFRDKGDAISARKMAEVRFNYHENHGRQPDRPVSAIMEKG